MAKDGMEEATLILAVDESYRVTLPQEFAKKVGWITGDDPHRAWMLVGGAGRCRLISSAEFDGDPDLKALRERIQEVSAPDAGLLEFQDDALAALVVRLLPVEIRRRGPGWRLTIPRPIAAMMEVRPAESDVVARLSQGRLEFWSLGTLRSAVSKPITQLL